VIDGREVGVVLGFGGAAQPAIDGPPRERYAHYICSPSDQPLGLRRGFVLPGSPFGGPPACGTTDAG